ncbi:MAG TPA: YbhB/YbcL family Raf kinase inhibitor-like protein [Epsilonproteobacteria bacterium]|nr:YbhB/YbcL family Raf kinase inhibitor-like protein [Campylobacterota bacterium]
MKYLLILVLGLSTLAAEGFVLSSSDLGRQLSKVQEYNHSGCNGQNKSPSLEWSNAPKSTRSFAITVFDPDAPTGSGWWHWAAVNIPANITEIKSGASGKMMPKGAAETLNDFGTAGFGGPCPPKGDKAHRYIFTIYALDVAILPVKAEMKDSDVAHLIDAHTISKASLVSRYRR